MPPTVRSGSIQESFNPDTNLSVCLSRRALGRSRAISASKPAARSPCGFTITELGLKLSNWMLCRKSSPEVFFPPPHTGQKLCCLKTRHSSKLGHPERCFLKAWQFQDFHGGVTPLNRSGYNQLERTLLKVYQPRSRLT